MATSAKKSAAKKSARAADDEKDFGQAQSPKHERVEVNVTVVGLDGDIDVITTEGALAVSGDAIFDADGLHTLVQALEQARQAL